MAKRERLVIEIDRSTSQRLQRVANWERRTREDEAAVLLAAVLARWTGDPTSWSRWWSTDTDHDAPTRASGA